MRSLLFSRPTAEPGVNDRLQLLIPQLHDFSGQFCAFRVGGISGFLWNRDSEVARRFGSAAEG